MSPPAGLLSNGLWWPHRLVPRMNSSGVGALSPCPRAESALGLVATPHFFLVGSLVKLAGSAFRPTFVG